MTTGRPAPMPPCEELLDALRRNALLLRELSARYGVELQPERPSSAPEIHSWHDVWRLLGEEMAALAQEQLRVLLLDSQNRLAGQRVIYQGSIDSVQARTAEVLRPAIVEAVPKIVLVHNHPSGDPAPSAADIAVTRDIDRAADLLDIELLDHVVIGRKGAVSFLDRGMLDGAA